MHYIPLLLRQYKSFPMPTGRLTTMIGSRSLGTCWLPNEELFHGVQSGHRPFPFQRTKLSIWQLQYRRNSGGSRCEDCLRTKWARDPIRKPKCHSCSCRTENQRRTSSKNKTYWYTSPFYPRCFGERWHYHFIRKYGSPDSTPGLKNHCQLPIWFHAVERWEFRSQRFEEEWWNIS